MGKNSLHQRLFVAAFVIAVLIGLVAGYTTHRNRLQVESERLEKRIMFDLELRQLRLHQFFEAKQTDLSLLANSPVIHAYIQGFNKITSPDYKKVADHFGGIQTYPNDEMVKLYGQAIEWGKSCINQFTFQNLLVVNLSGEVIFAVRLGQDFGTNLLKGPLSGSPAGTAIASLKENKGFFAGNLERYAPGGGEMAVFIGIALRENGINTGYMLVEVPARRIQTEIGMKGSLNYSQLTLQSDKTRLVFDGFDSTRNDDVLEKSIPINYFDSKGQTLSAGISRSTNLNLSPAYSLGVSVFSGLSVLLMGLFLVKIYRQYALSTVSVSNAMIVQSTWSSIIHNPEKIGRDFYATLFKDPQIGEVFKRLPHDADLPKRLVSMMSLIVNNSDRMDIIEGEIKKLAAMHVRMGVRPAFINPFIDCFIATVQKQYEGDFNPKLKQAWYIVLNEVGRIFVEVIEKEEGKPAEAHGA